MASSPFTAIPDSQWVASNALAFAVRDRYPVSPGHTLVIPRRHVATWFDATRDEQLALLDLIDVIKRDLDAAVPPPARDDPGHTGWPGSGWGPVRGRGISRCRWTERPESNPT